MRPVYMQARTNRSNAAPKRKKIAMPAYSGFFLTPSPENSCRHLTQSQLVIAAHLITRSFLTSHVVVIRRNVIGRPPTDGATSRQAASNGDISKSFHAPSWIAKVI